MVDIELTYSALSIIRGVRLNFPLAEVRQIWLSLVRQNFKKWEADVDWKEFFALRENMTAARIERAKRHAWQKQNMPLVLSMHNEFRKLLADMWYRERDNRLDYEL